MKMNSPTNYGSVAKRKASRIARLVSGRVALIGLTAMDTRNLVIKEDGVEGILKRQAIDEMNLKYNNFFGNSDNNVPIKSDYEALYGKRFIWAKKLWRDIKEKYKDNEK